MPNKRRRELFWRRLYGRVLFYWTWICFEGRNTNLSESSRWKRGCLVRSRALTIPSRHSAVNCYACCWVSEMGAVTDAGTLLLHVFFVELPLPLPPTPLSMIWSIQPRDGYDACILNISNGFPFPQKGYKMSSYIYFSGGWLWEIL